MMIVISYLFWMLFGIIIGIQLNKWYSKLLSKNANNKLIIDKNNQYKQILEKVNTKRSRFKTRVNNLVYVSVKLEEHGKVDVVVFLDKNDVAIFKNDKCIMTSDLVEKELINQIYESICRVHQKRIDDIVNFLGLTLSRSDFEKTTGIKINQILEQTGEMNFDNDNKKDKKLDINEILDRINEVGIDNLSVDEKEFLKNYKN